jgi:3-dehydroquinate dehydratase
VVAVAAVPVRIGLEAVVVVEGALKRLQVGRWIHHITLGSAQVAQVAVTIVVGVGIQGYKVAQVSLAIPIRR